MRNFLIIHQKILNLQATLLKSFDFIIYLYLILHLTAVSRVACFRYFWSRLKDDVYNFNYSHINV